MLSLIVFPLALLAATPSPAANVSVTIGDTALVIPTPDGFTQLTPQMTKLKLVMANTIAPTNNRLASFIDLQDAPAALNGNMPKLQRYMNVETAKADVDKFMTNADFSKFKDTFKSQNDEIMKAAEKQMPGMMDKMNKDLGNALHETVDLQINGIVPLVPHLETDRLLASTIIASINGADASVHKFVCTTTFVHVQGKLLLLYVYAPTADIAWTKPCSPPAPPTRRPAPRKPAARAGINSKSPPSLAPFVGPSAGFLSSSSQRNANSPRKETLRHPSYSTVYLSKYFL